MLTSVNFPLALYYCVKSCDECWYLVSY